MPRARGKGGKNTKKKKAMQDKERRELQFKDEGQEYGQVLRLLGAARVEVMCCDGKKRCCTIRGSMRNRVWIHAGDIILIGLRDFGDDGKADVMLKYYEIEARELQELGELPESMRIAEGGFSYSDDEEDGFDGAADSDDGEEEKKTAVDINNI